MKRRTFLSGLLAPLALKKPEFRERSWWERIQDWADQAVRKSSRFHREIFMKSRQTGMSERRACRNIFLPTVRAHVKGENNKALDALFEEKP